MAREHHGIVFVEVAAGSFLRGLSEKEEKALRSELSGHDDEDARAALAFLDEEADRMRPVARVTLAAFDLALDPLTDKQIAALLAPRAFEPGVLEGSLTAERAEEVIEALARHGMRLPSELEWEYAYRAGTTTPFPWGIEIPKKPWAPRNAFGFEGMGELAELCADGWQVGYRGAPTDGAPHHPDNRVTRGGAAQFWPWQGVGEWISMLSAYRSPASEHGEFLRLRPVRAA